MPINIPERLPAAETLAKENIFLMKEQRARSQDIRPLRIVILNLMPKKIETETQLLRVLSNTPLQLDIDLMHMDSHQSKNTSAEHLLKFYNTFEELKGNRYDGMIITGAPVEHLPFEQVDYWEELCRIFEWTKTNVYSTLYICWGAQAALYYYYGIEKHPLEQKMFGIFEHYNLIPQNPLMRGFDERFLAPHSRHTEIREKDVASCSKLDILASSPEAGVYLVCNKNCRRIFITGHSEYDRYTLRDEYQRDLDKGLPIEMPQHYFPGDDPAQKPIQCWRAHANLLFSNWLNYFLYQETPYDLSSLPEVNRSTEEA